MRAFAALAGILLSACVTQNDPRLKKSEKVDALEAETKALKDRVDSLQRDVWLLQAVSEPYKTATFDPGDPKGYGRIDTTGVPSWSRSRT